MASLFYLVERASFEDVRCFCLQHSPVGGAVKLKLHYTKTLEVATSAGLLMHIKEQAHSEVVPFQNYRAFLIFKKKIPHKIMYSEQLLFLSFAHFFVLNFF